MTNYKIINSEVVSLYNNSTFKSEITSQCLIWEKVELVDTIDNWFKVKQCDDYKGYIHKDCLVDLNSKHIELLSDKRKWFFVKDRLVEINLLNGNSKSFLSFGTLIPVIDKIDKSSCLILMPDNSKYIINSKSILSYSDNQTFNDLISIAKNNLGTPYFWGGRSGFGFDCSGFIQHLYKFIKIKLPRDCKEQVESEELYEVKSSYYPGDLIYFYKEGKVNHVGMFVNYHEFIHSSGSVKINSIDSDKYNFNKNFNEFDVKVFRIKETSFLKRLNNA